MSPRFARALPFLKWPRPVGALLRADARAGLTVGLMMVPQAVAYAHLAGMPPVTGIYVALLPALLAILLSSAVRLSVGPSALTALLVGASLTGLAEPGSAQWVQLAVWLALLSGLVQVGLGLFSFGWLLNLVSAPVLMAFTQAAAVLIIGSQLPGLLGLQGFKWAMALDPQLWPQVGWHGASALFGLGSLALLMLLRRWRPMFPGVLALVLASGTVSWALGFEAAGGAVIGPLPRGLPELALPAWPGWDRLQQLVMPTLVITLVSFLETASSARVETNRRGVRWDQDQDLLGQGVGKLASAFTGTFPASVSFSRSALNLYAGAQSGWAVVFCVIVVWLMLLAFTPLLWPVPQAVLSAIVVAAVLGLIKPREFVRLWALSRREAVIAALTAALTVAAAPALYWGVLAGVLMTLAFFVYERLRPRIIEVGQHPDGSLRDRHLWKLPPLTPRTLALRMDAALDFATAGALEQRLSDELTERPDTRHIVLLAQAINRMDATGAKLLAKLIRQGQASGRVWHLCGLKLPAERVLAATGALEPSERLHLHRTEADTVAALLRLQEKDLPPDIAAMAI